MTVRATTMRRVFVRAACLAPLLACGGDGTGPSVATLSLLNSSVALGLKATSRLTVFAHDASGKAVDDLRGLTWASANTAVVAVDDSGTVTGLSLGGPVAITARKGSATATAHVTVTPASISIAMIPAELDIGQTIQVAATPRDALGDPIAGTTVTWSSEPTGIVSITADGTLTALIHGMVKVIATAAGRSVQSSTGVRSVYDGIWTGSLATTPPVTALIAVRVGTVTELSLAIPRPPCTTLRVNVVASARINPDRAAFGVPQNGSFTATFSSASTMAGAVTSTVYGAVVCDNGQPLSGISGFGPYTFQMTKQ